MDTAVLEAAVQLSAAAGTLQAWLHCSPGFPQACHHPSAAAADKELDLAASSLLLEEGGAEVAQGLLGGAQGVIPEVAAAVGEAGMYHSCSCSLRAAHSEGPGYPADKA